MSTYIGTDASDLYSGNVLNGDNILYGLRGNDNLYVGGFQDAYIDGGAGNDYLYFGFYRTSITDPIFFAYGTIHNGEGSDTAFGAIYNDSIFGDNGNDFIAGGGYDITHTQVRSVGASGDDSLDGGSGVDAIYGFDGNDTLLGGDGDDIGSIITPAYQYFSSATTQKVISGLFGGDGDDQLDGEAGNDLLDGGAGADTLIGGSGYDMGSYGDASAGAVLDLANLAFNTGDAAGDSFSGIEVYAGSHLNDSLRGDAAANTLVGQEGDDFLDGREGSDGLIGGAGNDFLIGGQGIDALYGSTGDDTFYYRSLAGSDYRETLGDFVTGEDHVELVRAGFSDQLNLGALDPNRFVVGDGATQGFGQFIYNSAGNLFWDADGVGPGGAVSVVTLAGHPTLIASDILIV